MSDSIRNDGRVFVWTILALWLVAFVGSFVAFLLTPAEDFGLARGWNRIGTFFMWQTVASALAVICPILARRLPKGSGLKRLSFLPLGFLLLLVGAIVALVLWANYSTPDPAAYTPPGPVTAPAPGAASPAEPAIAPSE